MRIFDKLFGKRKPDSNNETPNQELRLEYNVMKNINLAKCEKHEKLELYKLVGNGIYQDLTDEDDAKYRMAISYELENDESNNQYPLEDILDRYLMHVSDFLENENVKGISRYKLELGGYLERMKEAQEIFGKKIYNQDFKDDDGKIRVKLIIESSQRK